MDNISFAYAYKNPKSNSISVYVSLPGLEQIIFYWSNDEQQQKSLPRWRVTREIIESGMEIKQLNDRGCSVTIDGKPAYFHWVEYDNVSNDPAHKGKLTNFGEWELDYDPAFNYDSPTSRGEHYSSEATGFYGQPQEYNYEENEE